MRVNPFRRFLSGGLRHALRQVREESGLNWRHRRALSQVPSVIGAKADLKLNLGCGPNPKTGWVNIDLFDSGAELQLDLRERWPFATGSVDHAYSEHVFEHFSYPDEVTHFLAEALRVLKPGGVIDIGVPDTEWPLKAYQDPSDEYWKLAKTKWHPARCETHLDHINYHFRQDGQHKYAWDEETLAAKLREAGFVSIERRDFDSTIDTESRQLGTLYMRGQKSQPTQPAPPAV
jgi:predicted SAM-dependent methyltransferase